MIYAAVSHQVRQLEEWLGARRTPRFSRRNREATRSQKAGGSSIGELRTHRR
ncbi:hypothetical protein [Sinorhizobium americanum]|uniref:hypothetical protein n=1 Tax=Sinorhizobium americanum TaxID=194963 RepID=UPI003CC93781